MKDAQIEKTGRVARKPLHESLASHAEAKARKKSDRVAKKLTHTGLNFHPKTGTLPRRGKSELPRKENA